MGGFRKNTCLINTGNNLTKEEREKLTGEHTKKYGIPKEISDQIVVPIVLDPPAPCDVLIDEIEKLREMYRCVYDIQLRLRQLRKNGGKNVANISLKAIDKRMKESDDDNKNNNNNNKVEEADDIEMKNSNEDNDKKLIKPVAMDEDTAMAMALSMSMKEANIDTPAIEKKAKKQTKGKNTAKKGATKKKSTRKSKKSAKKNSKKRNKMDEGDEEYTPGPKKKRVRTN